MHHLLPSTPLLFVLHESALSADSCREKGKSPLLRLICTLSAVIPNPPNVPSCNICAAIKHSNVTVRNTRVGVRSHMQRSANGCKKGEPRTFCKKELWVRSSAGTFIYITKFPLEKSVYLQLHCRRTTNGVHGFPATLATYLMWRHSHNIVDRTLEQHNECSAMIYQRVSVTINCLHTVFRPGGWETIEDKN